RYKASHVNAEPVALPKNRVGNAVPSEISGVDFAGPVYLKENQCLFTCAVYRAVHLELVTSLSADAFLEVLRRSIARRGRPTIIYSDMVQILQVQEIVNVKLIGIKLESIV
ncbi:hypothetical protein ILUMI_16752, partial [Ignelater luminosus]